MFGPALEGERALLEAVASGISREGTPRLSIDSSEVSTNSRPFDSVGDDPSGWLSAVTLLPPFFFLRVNRRPKAVLPRRRGDIGAGGVGEVALVAVEDFSVEAFRANP